MVSLYLAQIAPSSFITNPAEFQAADEMRRIQRLAYRAKSLSFEHYPELASSESTRSIWENDEAWQPLRETLEQLLLVYDWGEGFAVLNLGVKPAHDELLTIQLARLAERNDDELLALVLDDLTLDCRRSRAWSKALVAFAVEGRAENRELLRRWIEPWAPQVQRALEPLAAAFASAPVPADARQVTEGVVGAHREFLADCGFNPYDMLSEVEA
jgi:toluene monooxygenase system protein E